MIKLKKWYLKIIEKDKRNVGEHIFYCLLIILSYIYGFIVMIRNFLYDAGIKKCFISSKKVISIGNLSWAGSGKTTLAIYLYEKLFKNHKTAILRRGYGTDEGLLLKEKTDNVFSSPNRVNMVKKLSDDFDVFILDDGFQHRALGRNTDIVVMGAREFRNKYRLIPAYIFREPLRSLKRAQVLLINYKDKLPDYHKIKDDILDKFKHLKVYFATYTLDKFVDSNNNELSLTSLKEKKLAAFTATGYPKGFFDKLGSLNLDITRQIVYPDHYQLNTREFDSLANDLIEEGIRDLIITAKDKYHLPQNQTKLNVYVMEISIKIDNEDEFLNDIEKCLA
jgi:tetraacyldisaccharide 4'-kinase